MRAPSSTPDASESLIGSMSGGEIFLLIVGGMLTLVLICFFVVLWRRASKDQ